MAILRSALVFFLAAGCTEASFNTKTNDPVYLPVDSDEDPTPEPEPEPEPEPMARLVVDPPRLDFGYVVEGTDALQVVELTNVGDTALEVSEIMILGSGAYALEGVEDPSVLDVGEATTLGVRFLSTNSDESAQLAFLTNDALAPSVRVPLDGTGANPLLVGTPNPMAFGEAVWGSPVTQALTLTNPGNAPVTVGALMPTPAAFTVTFTGPLVIDAGASADVDVHFDPRTAGPVAGLLGLTSDARVPAIDVVLGGSGIGAPTAQCAAQPRVIGLFGGSSTFSGAGSSDPQAGPLTYDWAFVSTPAGSGVVMPAGGQDRGPIVPDLAGDYTAELVVTNDRGLVSPPCQATFTYSDHPRLLAAPDPLRFGDVAEGAQLTLPLTLTNPGNVDTTVSSIVSTEAVFTHDLGAPVVLGPGATHDVQVTFTPVGARTFVGDLVISSNATGPSATSVRVDGTSLGAPTARCDVTPQAIGGLGGHATFSGAGSSDPQGRPLTYDWRLVAQPSGSTVTMPAGTVQRGPFYPDRAGAYTGELVVTNDLGLSSLPCQATLTYADHPRLVATPDPLRFGDVLVNTTSTLQLTLSNPGNTDVTVSGISATDAAFVARLGGARVIAPGGSTQVPVDFAPPAVQAYVGDLLLTHTGTGPSDGSVRVDGTGIGDPVAVCAASGTPITAIHEDFMLYGRNSYDPGGRTITQYNWTFTSVPGGSRVTMPAGGADRGPITPDSVGPYVAQLVVVNDLGRSSPPCTVTVEAEPNASLWIELYWQHDEDIDLHLIRGNGTRNDLVDDCHWNNCIGGLSWGLAGTADDAYLDLDDIDFTGPENINIASPYPDVYKVVVHDYDWPAGYGRDYTGSNGVTVKIYIDGALAYSEVFTVSGEDTWHDIARIQWVPGNPTITPI